MYFMVYKQVNYSAVYNFFEFAEDVDTYLTFDISNCYGEKQKLGFQITFPGMLYEGYSRLSDNLPNVTCNNNFLINCSCLIACILLYHSNSKLRSFVPIISLS